MFDQEPARPHEPEPEPRRATAKDWILAIALTVICLAFTTYLIFALTDTGEEHEVPCLIHGHIEYHEKCPD